MLASKKKAAWSRHRSVLAHVFANRVQLRAGRRDGPRLFGSRYHEVVYEELLANPRAVLHDLAGRLGLDYEEGMLAFGGAAEALVSADELAWKRETLGPLLAANAGKWRRDLSLMGGGAGRAGLPRGDAGCCLRKRREARAVPRRPSPGARRYHVVGLLHGMAVSGVPVLYAVPAEQADELRNRSPRPAGTGAGPRPSGPPSRQRNTTVTIAARFRSAAPASRSPSSRRSRTRTTATRRVGRAGAIAPASSWSCSTSRRCRARPSWMSAAGRANWPCCTRCAEPW